MVAGKIIQLTSARGAKKRVLSNKQLTKQVRTLNNHEGSRKMVGAQMSANITLTAGTALIKYFDDDGVFSTGGETIIHHYYDMYFKFTAAADSTVRILYGFDNAWDGTNLLVAELLTTVGDSTSPLLSGDVVSLRESNHKNREEDYRGVIVKDMLIALEAGVAKVFKVRLPLFNRKTRPVTGQNQVAFFPFLLLLADESDAIISIGCNYYRTALGT